MALLVSLLYSTQQHSVSSNNWLQLTYKTHPFSLAFIFVQQIFEWTLIIMMIVLLQLGRLSSQWLVVLAAGYSAHQRMAATVPTQRGARFGQQLLGLSRGKTYALWPAMALHLAARVPDLRVLPAAADYNAPTFYTLKLIQHSK